MLLTTVVAGADPLQSAPPNEVGFSAERLGRIGGLLKAHVDRGQIPGAVALVARKGRVAYFESVGFRDKETTAAMPKDAIFRIYSMTKPMASVDPLLPVIIVTGNSDLEGISP